MSELDEKLNSILSNPQMMQQIMSLAQSMNQSAATPEQPPNAAQASDSFGSQAMDLSLLGKLSNIMERGSIDKNQQSLLKALGPYLSREKIQKLERAMHAAKMAGIASEVVKARGSNPFSGR